MKIQQSTCKKELLAYVLRSVNLPPPFVRTYYMNDPLSTNEDNGKSPWKAISRHFSKLCLNRIHTIFKPSLRQGHLASQVHRGKYLLDPLLLGISNTIYCSLLCAICKERYDPFYPLPRKMSKTFTRILAQKGLRMISSFNTALTNGTAA